jgi:hypothetical protein
MVIIFRLKFPLSWGLLNLHAEKRPFPPGINQNIKSEVIL